MRETEKLIATCNTLVAGHLSGSGVVWLFDSATGAHRIVCVDRDDNEVRTLFSIGAGPVEVEQARLAFIVAVADMNLPSQRCPNGHDLVNGMCPDCNARDAYERAGGC